MKEFRWMFTSIRFPLHLFLPGPRHQEGRVRSGGFLLRQETCEGRMRRRQRRRDPGQERQRSRNAAGRRARMSGKKTGRNSGGSTGKLSGCGLRVHLHQSGKVRSLKFENNPILTKISSKVINR